MKSKVLRPEANRDTSSDGEEVEISDFVFGIKPNRTVIHQCIVAEQANQRQGTASTKDRSQVKGSTRKPWRQKGTGRARAGSVKSPIWRGGGTIFGPKPKSYSQHLNKKVKKLSIRSILSEKLQQKKLFIIQDLSESIQTTKNANETLYSLSQAKELYQNLKNRPLRKKIRNHRAILITQDEKKLLKRSIRNLPWMKTLSYNRLNSYDLYHSHEILIEQTVLSPLETFYQETRSNTSEDSKSKKPITKETPKIIESKKNQSKITKTK